MFIFTTRLTRKKLFLAVGAAAILICGVTLLIQGNSRAEAAHAEVPSVKRIKTSQDRAGYLDAYGWKVSTASESAQEVVIPREFDQAFEEYNSLQKNQGFDLAKYKGKRVMRYVYDIENYPGDWEIVYASVLVYKNTIIGGDVQCPMPDGFIHGFESPGEQSPSPSALPKAS